MKDFDVWNIAKKNIHKKEFKGYIHERELWWCSLGLNVGDEEDGKNDQFERPVLIIRKFNQRIVLIVPLTTKVKENQYYFPFTHDTVAFAVIISQLRLISTNRLTRKIRKMDQDLFREIKEKIIMVIFQ